MIHVKAYKQCVHRLHSRSSTDLLEAAYRTRANSSTGFKILPDSYFLSWDKQNALLTSYLAQTMDSLMDCQTFNKQMLLKSNWENYYYYIFLNSQIGKGCINNYKACTSFFSCSEKYVRTAGTRTYMKTVLLFMLKTKLVRHSLGWLNRFKFFNWIIQRRYYFTKCKPKPWTIFTIPSDEWNNTVLMIQQIQSWRWNWESLSILEEHFDFTQYAIPIVLQQVCPKLLHSDTRPHLYWVAW